MKGLLFAALLLVASVTFAGPPEGAKKLMIPYPSICTPGMAEMMGALTTDYAVHISMTFEESPVTGVVIVHNPNTKAAAVLHVSEARTCLVFSGQNLKMFNRPEGMAPPKVELEDFEES
jgi:hypothetical protein